MRARDGGGEEVEDVRGGGVYSMMVGGGGAGDLAGVWTWRGHSTAQSGRFRLVRCGAQHDTHCPCTYREMRQPQARVFAAFVKDVLWGRIITAKDDGGGEGAGGGLWCDGDRDSQRCDT